MSDISAAVPMKSVVPSIMPDDLELAVIPKPKIETPTDRMLPLARPTIVCPVWDRLRAGREHLKTLLDVQENAVVGNPAEAPCDGTLILIGVPRTDTTADPVCVRVQEEYARLEYVPNRTESYVLKITEENGRCVIVIAAPEPRGVFYAIQTLKQIAYRKNGTVYVRLTTIIDWPTFPARGSKRTREDYEYALKANFQFVNHSRPDAARDHFADWWMAYTLPSVRDPSVHEKHNWVIDASPEGIQRLKDWVVQSHARGAQSYCLHLDDQFMRMTEETRDRFKGDYFAALSHALHETHREIKRIDPAATLYFLPTTYWTNSPYEDYAAQLEAAGGLPHGCGLVLCGPQVTSPAFPIEEIRRCSGAFGATGKALIYSNHFRDREFYPLEKQPAELAEVLIGIAPERGTATTRATRLDWSWNPEAYDPERSHMLAVREFSGLENWPKVYDLIREFVSMPPDSPELDPHTAAQVCLDRLDRVGALLAQLEHLPNQGLNGRVELPGEKTDDGYAYHLVKQIKAAYESLNENREIIRNFTFRTARAGHTDNAPEIDGILDDAAWENAPAIGPLMVEGRPVPEDQNACIQCLYDDKNLYLGCRLNPGTPLDFDAKLVALGVPMPNGRTPQTGPDLRAAWGLGGWNAIAVMLDPKLDRRTCYEFQVNAAGRYADGWYSMTDPEAPGLFWNSGWRCAVAAAEGGTGWTAEIAIPWKDLGITPKSSRAIGMQISHNTPGAGRMAAWAMCPWGAIGVQDPRRFGFIILE